VEAWLEDFRQIIDSAAPRLLQISDAKSREPQAEEQWSAKQIIGHLIDSAANNHARFVVAQSKDDLVFPGYDQDHWVAVQHYQEASWPELIDLWRAYNLHLVHVMASASKVKMQQPRSQHSLELIAFKTVDTSQPATLEYLMKDYVDHLKHHLSQIFPDGVA